MPTTKKTDKAVNFEESLEKLESLVENLESGDLSLDESLKYFEQGVELYKNCKTKLDQTEKKLSLLTEQMKEEKLEFRGDQE